MASGSAWRVLAEEYQFRKIEDRKLNKFTTICLSADSISDSFYSEFVENLEGYIIAQVYLGKDYLFTYISDSLKEYWKIGDAITQDVLGQKIQEIINTQIVIIGNKPKKVSVFTTNKTSGTLESYKKCLSNYIHLEEMIDSAKVSIFYDNMKANDISTYTIGNKHNIFREFVILGSQYYTVKGKGKPIGLMDSNSQYIYKEMYLYFLAKETSNDNEYKIDKRIVKFLKKLEKHNNSIKSAQPKWDEIMKNGIIYYDKSTHSRYPNIIRIN